MTTPTLPGWVRDYRAAAYSNVYEADLCPGETRLYGTESLFGDWGGALLLLAKDFAPRSLVADRLAAGDPRPYHHTDWRATPRAPGAATNRNLATLAAPVPGGKLYGSALAGLLRNDGEVSGDLPDFDRVAPFARDVLRFTVAHMPNLRAIACLGRVAWEVTTTAVGARGADWTEHRMTRRPARAGSLCLHALAHTSRWPGGRARIEGDWAALADTLNDPRSCRLTIPR